MSSIFKLLLIIVFLGIENIHASNTIDRLFNSLEDYYIPYGKNEITEKDIISSFGEGSIFIKDNSYIRRTYHSNYNNLWIQFEFNGDEPGNPLVAIVFSKLPFDNGDKVPTIAIKIPKEITRLLSMNKNQISSVFNDNIIKTNRDSSFIPKVSGPSFKPKIVNNIVYPIEFYFNNDKLAVIAIHSP